jgi:hypothetical protein
MPTTTKKRKSAKRSTKKVAEPKPVAAVTIVDLSVHSEAVTYMLRTSKAGGIAYSGFRYPETGLVKCDTWSHKPVCGYGLHGLLHGAGKQALLYADDKTRVWQVLRVRRADIVYVTEDEGGKWKVPEAFVVHTGTMDSATKILRELDEEVVEGTLPGGAASNSGYQGAASNSGTRGAASNSGEYGAASNSGTRGAASNSGYQGAASNSGYQGAASNSGEYGAASNSGYQGAASNSGTRGAASNSGEYGAASNSGYQGAASNSGYQGAASNSGYQGAASNSGYQGAASNSGYQGAASNSGYQGAASNSGDQGAASNSGDQGAAIARNGSRARSTVDTGVLIFIDDSGSRPRVITAYPGEDDIKVGTWYKVRDGKLVESPDNDPEYLTWVDGSDRAKQIESEAGVEGKKVLVELQAKKPAGDE